MPEDPTPLAQRLRSRVLEALHEPARIEDFGASLQAAADAAVVAVLRELASRTEGMVIMSDPAGCFRRLADSIEKGEAGDGPQ